MKKQPIYLRDKKPVDDLLPWYVNPEELKQLAGCDQPGAYNYCADDDNTLMIRIADDFTFIIQNGWNWAPSHKIQSPLCLYAL